MSASADRNMLLGILALQMDFVTREQLIAGMNAWVLDKSKLLDEVLFEQRALKADTRVLLTALVAKHLELHAGDAQKSLAAVSSVGSLRENLKALADPDIEASLSIAGTARDPDATLSWSVGAATSAGQRFRILRPHARGGLGQVSVALDSELSREVALKEILNDHAHDPVSRSRFVLEAEITGGLEHPGIVPVYGLGQYADGRPFYAMRFIRGDSLKEAIDRFHAVGKPAFQGVAFRQLLGRFIDVCNAVAYAHSRGVLHRDLKPGNIMLGKYGETLVVDWGLAKVHGRAGPYVDETEMSLRPQSASGSSATLAGEAIGTPAFMSPEQAAGQFDQLGPHSDVYSLGATLYTLLTGKPPFAKEEIATTLRKVKCGEFAPPKSLNPSVPTALHAICMKSMALDTTSRYHSPREMADDLEQYLADAPISALPESFNSRAARWIRHHRSWVVSGMATMLIAVVALTGWLGLMIHQRQVTKRHLHESLYRTAASLAGVDFSTESGWRQESLTAIREAAAIKNDPRLRDVAAQALFATDRRVDRSIALGFAAKQVSLAPNESQFFAASNSLLDFYSFPDARSLGSVSLPAAITSETRWMEDGQTLACGLVTGEVAMVDATARRIVGRFRVPMENESQLLPIAALAIGPGPDCLTLTDGNELEIWNWRNGKMRSQATLRSADIPPPPAPTMLQGIPVELESGRPALTRDSLGRFGPWTAVAHAQPPQPRFSPKVVGVAVLSNPDRVYVAIEYGQVREFTLEANRLINGVVFDNPAWENVQLLRVDDRRLILVGSDSTIRPPVTDRLPPSALRFDNAPRGDESWQFVAYRVPREIQPQESVDELFDDSPFSGFLPQAESADPLLKYQSPHHLRRAHVSLIDTQAKELLDSLVISIGDVIGVGLHSQHLSLASKQGRCAVVAIRSSRLELVSHWNALPGTVWSSFAMASDQTSALSTSSSQRLDAWTFDSDQLARVLSAPTDSMCPLQINADSLEFVRQKWEETLTWCDWPANYEQSVSYDGTVLAFGHAEGTGRFISLLDDSSIAAVDRDPAANHSARIGVPSEKPPTDDAGPCRPTFLRVSSQFAAVGNTEGSVAVWSLLPEPQFLRYRREGDQHIVAFGITEDSELMAVGTDEGSVSLWQSKDENWTRSLGESGQPVSALCFSKDAQALTISRLPSTLCELDVKSGQVKWERLTDRLITQIESNEQYIAAGHADGRISLWDRNTGTRIAQWKGHAVRLQQITFCPDGRLVSVDILGGTILWELEKLLEQMRNLGLAW